MKQFIVFIFFILNCSILELRKDKIQLTDFNYQTIQKNHFNYRNETPFPLTVRSGVNTYNSTTSDGRYLFFASDAKGNFDIYMRDLSTSTVVQVTDHPAPQYKPNISPDGKKLVFVSERFDSDGDIVLTDFDPEEAVNLFQKGKWKPNLFKQNFITNPKYEDVSKIIRNLDTDPTWSNDSRYIAFSTKMFDSLKPEIAIIDTKNNFAIKRITSHGGTSPSFSPDGKKIFFISYKDSKQGEIYSIDILTKEEIRITNDSFLDFSPSLSSDGKNLFYTSIRKDTDKNKKIDIKDHSILVKRNLETNLETEISTTNISIFDTKYSNFNNGSILFTASINSALNIYFIPDTGFIPKKDNIEEQYEYSKQYKNNSSEFYELAFESLKNFFGNDPYYYLYRSRADRQLYIDLVSEGNTQKAQEVYNQMINTKLDKQKGLSYALAVYQKNIFLNQDPSKELIDYYTKMKNLEGVETDIPPTILMFIADYFEGINRINEAEKYYQQILDEYPKFHRIPEIKRKESVMEYRLNKSKLPKEFISIINDEKASGEDKKFILDELLKNLSGEGNFNEKKELSDKYILENDLKNNCPEIFGLLNFVKAQILYEKDQFEESNSLIDSYISLLKKSSYIYLKSKLLKSDNFRVLGKEDESNAELLSFIEDYDYKTNLEVKITEFERAFSYFETKAREYERANKFRRSIKNIINNNLILSYSKQNKLPIEKLYNLNSANYQKLMVDSSFLASQREQNSGITKLYNQINLLGNKRLDVVGNFTESLAYLFRWKGFRIFGDFRDLQILSPFNESSFNLMKEYFSNRKKKSTESLEYATIFGEAYYLITRSAFEESFYIKERVLTYKRKEQILINLKQAESDLQWILYADPKYTDAYLLLGWMYQYIDIRKEEIVFPENDFDKEVFRELYLKYFPLRNLEENIDIYNQILSFLGPKFKNKKVLSDIHLNLGNSYYLLEKIDKAKDSYSKVDEYSKSILDRAQFDNYKQKALYYFNYARVKFKNKNKDLESSIYYFNKSLEIYYKYEYYPLLSKLGITQNSELTEELINTKKKIAMIHSLIGLVYIELEEYNKAIVPLTTALSMNGKTDYINDISLYNSLAICYQKIGDYKKSDLALKKADYKFKSKKALTSNIKEKILGFNIGDMFWDTILPQDQRVIGDGRFPDRIPLEYENLITRGIRIKNAKDKNEYDDVKNFILFRDKYLSKEGIDKSIIGKKIIENKFTDLATSEFDRGNYFESASLFTKEYEFLKKKNEKKKAFQSYIKSDIALYFHIEQNSEEISKLIAELNNNIKFLNQFKKEELEICKKELPKTDEFIQGENLDRACLDKFYSDFYNYDFFLGNNYFYLAEIYSSQKEFEKSFSNYGIALQLYKEPSGVKESEIGLENDKYSSKERARLKTMLSIVYLRLGENKLFEKYINEAFYIANEYTLSKELVYIYTILAEYNFLISNHSKTIDYISLIENYLKENPGLFYDIDEIFINYVYSIKSSAFVELKKVDELEMNREKLYSAIFFRQLLINEFNFQDKEILKYLNDLQALLTEDKNLIYNIEYLNQTKSNLKNIINLKQKNLEEFKIHINSYKKYFSEYMDFVSWFNTGNNSKPKIKNDEILVQYFSAGDTILELTKTSTKTKTKKFKIKNKDDSEKIAEELFKTLLEFPDLRKLILIPAPYLYKIDFPSLKVNNEMLGSKFRLRILFRVSQLFRENDSEFSRLKRITSVRTEIKEVTEEDYLINPINLVLPKVSIKKDIKEINFREINSNELKNFLADTDILEGATDFTNRKHYLGEKKNGLISMKELLEEQWTVPILILTNYQKSQDNFLKMGFIYDLLQFAGVQSIVLMEPKKENAKIRDNLISNIKSANDIIQANQLTLIGESIQEVNTKESYYNKLFQEYTDLSIAEERKRNYLKSMKYLLLANAVIPEDKYELQVKSEINLAKLKTKAFPSRVNYLRFYEELLSKYRLNPVEEDAIRFQLLVSCYESILNPNCKSHYDEYMNSAYVNQDLKFIISFYKNLRQGNISYINENYTKFISIKTDEDQFLKNLRLSNLFSKAFYWSKSREHANISLQLAKNKTETYIAQSKLSDIEYEIFFIKGKNPKFEMANNIYYYGSNKIWEEYRRKTKELSLNESNKNKQTYQQILLDAFEKMETSYDYEPISLGPLFLKDGRPSLYLLKDSERDFLFYLLVKSISYQKATELNNQFDILLDTEKNLDNNNRVAWMLVSWASELKHRGDFLSSKNYFDKLKLESIEKNSDKELREAYYNLKFKLSNVYSELKLTESEFKFLSEDLFSYYKLADSTSEEDLFELVNLFIKNYKFEKLDLYHLRELEDFIEYLQQKALSKKNYFLFTDLGYAQNLLLSYTDKIYGRQVLFSDLPKFTKVSQKIANKLPIGQSFINIIDFRIKSFITRIKDKKIELEECFEDNREIKNLIYEYIFSIKDGGDSISTQEYIENLYKSKLKFTKGKIDYIYLPNYHFKAPIESTEQDNYYYVLSPEIVVERNLYDTKKDFLPNFKIIIPEETYTNTKTKFINDLEKFEVKYLSGKGNGRDVRVIQDDLFLNKGKEIYFGKKRISELTKNTNPNPNEGVWFLSNNLLEETSIQNDDFVHSLVRIDKIYSGPSVINFGLQNNLNDPMFMKVFFKKLDYKLGFEERFYDSFVDVQDKLKEDKYWIGYKPYTNVLLK
jgi:Tol biopolymer transport system component